MKVFVFSESFESRKENYPNIKSVNLTEIISSIRNLRSELNIPYKKNIDLNINSKENNRNIFIESIKSE